MAFILLDVVILTPQKSERTATLTVALHFDILFGSKIMTNITGNPCNIKIPSQSIDVKNRDAQNAKCVGFNTFYRTFFTTEAFKGLQI